MAASSATSRRAAPPTSTGAASCSMSASGWMPGAEADPALNAPRAGGADARGIGALCLGAAAIGFAPIGVRLADVSPTASAFWRLALAALALWPIAAAARRSHGGETRRDVFAPAVLVAGLFFAADLGVWHLSIAYTSVANATLEANFAPVFVTLATWLLFRQPVSRSFVIALALTLAGAAVLIGPHVSASGRALLGDGLGCLTA